MQQIEGWQNIINRVDQNKLGQDSTENNRANQNQTEQSGIK